MGNNQPSLKQEISPILVPQSQPKIPHPQNWYKLAIFGLILLTAVAVGAF